MFYLRNDLSDTGLVVPTTLTLIYELKNNDVFSLVLKMLLN